VVLDLGTGLNICSNAKKIWELPRNDYVYVLSWNDYATTLLYFSHVQF